MSFTSIGFICNEYPPCANGGIGTFTREISEALAERGVNVYVVGIYDDIEDEQKEMINGVHVYRLPSNKGRLGLLANRLALYRRTKQLIEEFDIQLVETYDFMGLTAFWPALKVPLICRLHGSIHYFYDEMGINGTKSSFWKFIEENALRKCHDIVSVSDYTAQRTNALFGLNRKITTIYNGVAQTDLPQLSTQTRELNGGFKVIFAGSVIKKKGVLQLAKAWKQLSQRFPDAHLYLVGKDTENRVDEIRQIINEDSFTYLGLMPKNELIALYHIVDLAIFPSYSEAFSLAPMEAMKEGVPVIYTTRASGKELIEDGVEGLLIDPDNIDEIENAIIKLMTMPEQERNRMAQKGQKKIETTFNFDTTISKNIDYYQSLIDAK